jgi:hypothetical protein
VHLVEGPLHRVQGRALPLAGGDALDRGDLAAVGLDGQAVKSCTVQAPQLLVSQPTTVPTLPSCSLR